MSSLSILGCKPCCRSLEELVGNQGVRRVLRLHGGEAQERPGFKHGDGLFRGRSGLGINAAKTIASFGRPLDVPAFDSQDREPRQEVSSVDQGMGQRHLFYLAERHPLPEEDVMRMD